ncbi:hypothetical protein S40293_11554 [Stachybotrys chartarum IBT 40293]|nr:hypothetical protein S40293_11554 [Stachybotrys chartarum IBT 40293]
MSNGPEDPAEEVVMQTASTSEEAAASQPKPQEREAMEQIDLTQTMRVTETPDYLTLAGDELEARVRLARREHRDKKRRQYLRDIATIGESSIPLSQLDDPINRIIDPEESYKRRRLEGQTKINIKVPTLARDQFRDVSCFIRDLTSVFKLYQGEFEKDDMKALYMSTCLQGAWKQRWDDYLTSELGSDISKTTWEEIQEWLKDCISDGPTRTTIAIKQLRSLNQGANQTFNEILHKFNDIIAEMGVTPCEQIKIGMFLNILNDEIFQATQAQQGHSKNTMVKPLKEVQNQSNPKIELANHIMPGQGIKPISFAISVGKLGMLLHAAGHLIVRGVIAVVISPPSMEKVGVV